MTLRVATSKSQIDARLAEAQIRNRDHKLVNIGTDSATFFRSPTIFLLDDDKELLTSFSRRRNTSGDFFAWSFLSSKIKPTETDFQNSLVLGLSEALSRWGIRAGKLSATVNDHCPWLFETSEGRPDLDLVDALVIACNRVTPGSAVRLIPPQVVSVENGVSTDRHGLVYAHTVPLRPGMFAEI